MIKISYFSFNLTNPIKLINIKTIIGNHTDKMIGIFPVSPNTISIASAKGAEDVARAVGDIIPIRAIEENK